MASSNKKSCAFLLLGGFLGAGKTTVMLRLAQRLVSRGLRVGIISNDQDEGLVDTSAYRMAGHATVEIASGCFCCHRNDLLTAVEELQSEVKPDLILAEPVGSCTDIVNQVIIPLQRDHGEMLEVLPYATVLDPFVAQKVLEGAGPAALSERITYLYKMQQNEAEIILINKIDSLASIQREEALALARRNFPQAEILPISALTGEGFDVLESRLLGHTAEASQGQDVDYAIYGPGEQELGWCNCQIRLGAEEPVEGEACLLHLARELALRLSAHHAVPGHIKWALMEGDQITIVNQTLDSPQPVCNVGQDHRYRFPLLTLNARILGDPHILAAWVNSQLPDALTHCGFPGMERHYMNCFRPALPVKTEG